MIKNNLKFEISFNLNTVEGEQLEQRSIRDFKDCLEGFVREWNGYHGHFYAFGSYLGDRDVTPTAVKVKRIK